MLSDFEQHLSRLMYEPVGIEPVENLAPPVNQGDVFVYIRDLLQLPHIKTRLRVLTRASFTEDPRIPVAVSEVTECPEGASGFEYRIRIDLSLVGTRLRCLRPDIFLNTDGQNSVVAQGYWHHEPVTEDERQFWSNSLLP